MRVLLSFFGLLCLTSCESQGTRELRSDEPVSRAIATYQADFIFPENAFDVYYLVFSDGTKLVEFYRFDLKPVYGSDGNPEQTPLDSVRYLLSTHSRAKQRSTEYTGQRILPNIEQELLFPQPEARFLPMTWWNPEEVTDGFTLGELKAGEIFIVVDENNSRIYYHYFNE